MMQNNYQDQQQLSNVMVTNAPNESNHGSGENETSEDFYNIKRYKITPLFKQFCELFSPEYYNHPMNLLFGHSYGLGGFKPLSPKQISRHNIPFKRFSKIRKMCVGFFQVEEEEIDVDSNTIQVKSKAPMFYLKDIETEACPCNDQLAKYIRAILAGILSAKKAFVKSKQMQGEEFNGCTFQTDEECLAHVLAPQRFPTFMFNIDTSDASAEQPLTDLLTVLEHCHHVYEMEMLIDVAEYGNNTHSVLVLLDSKLSSEVAAVGCEMKFKGLRDGSFIQKNENWVHLMADRKTFEIVDALPPPYNKDRTNLYYSSSPQ